ncbi:thioredoxin-like protein [Periconia macrospinosa]|uniref:Thioredoxin-like protein n=1 Tax=Periconia macrospinosa TaxID=97972 RepID=A0A2V1E014_9PLEO|nr:thioredoxin-like protein [Periconia macrospinosa]
MATPTTISSPTDLETLLSTTDYTLIDFWATWCPPCKAIAPLFNSLASDNSVPSQLAFAKVDVDAQAQIAKHYKISAMPTFLLVERGGAVKKAVRGADPKAIKWLVEYARKKSKGEKVGEKDEEMFSQTEFGDGGGGGLVMPILLIAFAVWYFFLK